MYNADMQSQPYVQRSLYLSTGADRAGGKLAVLERMVGLTTRHQPAQPITWSYCFTTKKLQPRLDPSSRNLSQNNLRVSFELDIAEEILKKL